MVYFGFYCFQLNMAFYPEYIYTSSSNILISVLFYYNFYIVFKNDIFYNNKLWPITDKLFCLKK